MSNIIKIIQLQFPPHFNFMYAKKFGNSKANNLFSNICKVTETINEEKYNYVFIMLL